MRKAAKIIMVAVVFAAIVPALAGLAVSALWNNIVVAACGFAAIGFWEGVGLFVLGQFLSAGFVLGMFMFGGSMHAIGHHYRGDWGRHWHKMSDEQRAEFIERRRAAFGFAKPGCAEGHGGE